VNSVGAVNATLVTVPAVPTIVISLGLVINVIFAPAINPLNGRLTPTLGIAIGIPPNELEVFVSPTAASVAHVSEPVLVDVKT